MSSDTEWWSVLIFLKVGRVWPEPLNTQKTKLKVQLEKIQDQVKEAYDKVKRSSVFNAKIFLEVFAVNV